MPPWSKLLQEAGSLLHRGEKSIAHQREVIETLARGGHDATAAKMLLRRLESGHARRIAGRNRLFMELADGPVMPGAVTLALTARNSELDVDPYRTTVVVQTSSHFFSDGAPNVRRKRKEGLPRRTTAPLERTIVGIE